MIKIYLRLKVQSILLLMQATILLDCITMKVNIVYLIYKYIKEHILS